MVRRYNNTSSDASSDSTTRALGRSENLEGKLYELRVVGGLRLRRARATNCFALRLDQPRGLTRALH